MESSKQRKKAYNAKWFADNRERELAKMKTRREKIKDSVYEAYGGPYCRCCGEGNKKFLTIDHINNDGNIHRAEIGNRGGIGWYYWLVEHQFPPGFQVLCYNCNMGKARNKGICPHKEKLMKANPLGNLEYELVVNGVTEGSSLKLDGAPGFRIQVPVKDGLAGQDTFKQDAMKTTSRADVEKRRMHIDSGIDIKGVDMFKELGGGTGGSAKEFTSDKSA